MNLKSIIAVLGIMIFMVSQAHAMSLRNEDAKAYDIQIVEGEGSAVVESFILDEGDELEDFCQDGCTLQLPDGTIHNFAGHESVSILDGAFVIAE